MPTLTGTVADVTGTDLASAQIRRVYVKARAHRPSVTDGEMLIVTAPVDLGVSGTLSVALEPGPAVLVVDTHDGGPDVYELHVTADMSLLSEAIDESAPARERSWAESVMVQLRADAIAAAGRAETAAEGVDAAIEGAADQVVARVEGDRVAAEQAASAAGSSAAAAAGSASVASSSASDAAGSASAAESSASAASGSAGDAAGFAAASAGSASAAADSASTASGGAQIITDNLPAIEAAPGHAADAQAARTGAESARDAAAGSASDAAGSAAAAAGSASDADESKVQAQAARSGAATARDLAYGHRQVAESASTTAQNARGQAQTAAFEASGHADAAAVSASAASGSAVTASTKAGEAAGSATDAAAALAQVLVELSNTQAYQDVLTAIGDMSSNWQADIAAAIADLVGQAPETLDTIAEVATALGNDPNFFTTVMTAIGERVKNDDPRLSDARSPTTHDHTMSQVTGLDDALDGKSDVGHGHEWSQISKKPPTYPPTAHDHAKAEVGLDAVDNTSDMDKPVSTAQAAAISAKADRTFVESRPAMWLWSGTGTWSPPAAANNGDSVLNLDSGEIHSITEV